ncbi:unnamed protein product [Albugo candida]|uniref:CBM20 domain-containing protein n=1 Tax=Albugo candida TaxID=65357 RepID=A0A024G520_9STRA|nr:unnamed protein product [Albugo candida]|eukprot:CCI41939.1 unnamed protein product [Albugo candida]
MLQRLRHVVGWGLPTAPPGTRVDFQVRASIGHGQTVYLVGDIPSLGGSIEAVPTPSSCSGGSKSMNATSGNSSSSNVSLEHGVALVTTPDLYPIWYNLEPIMVPSGTRIHYRYAICTGSKFTRYETLDGISRQLQIGNEDLQTNDTLDTLQSSAQEEMDDKYGGRTSFWSVVPRLSSGQAFVDRRANGIAEKDGTMTGRNLTLSITGGIPEEEEHHETSEISSSLHLGEDECRVFCSSPAMYRSRAYSEESAKSPRNVTIDASDGVIIVVYRLPVLVIRQMDGNYLIEWEDDNLLCPPGFLKESDKSMSWDQASSMRITWVGTVHCSSVIPKEDEEKLVRLLMPFRCVPVFLSQNSAQTFHDFCYGTLWPIFHNIVDVYGKLPTRWWNPTQQKNAWAAYKNVNRIFVNKVIEVYNEGDLVWVHGFHLLVAPSFLSRRLPVVNVGLYLHTPFPSSEIFRTLSVRADLLRGMLSADHIGFHLYEHARHFLTSCRRILGVKYSAQPGGYIGIEYNGRVVMLTISHIGIETSFMDIINDTDTVKREYQRLMEKYDAGNRRIIVGIDRVERLKGIILKISSIEHFLNMYPEWQCKLQVIQVGIIDSSNPSSEKTNVREEVIKAVERTNERFKGVREDPVIVYKEVENTDLAARLPLWRLGNIFLSTSVRDAVNLYPFEFVYAHQLCEKPGVLIVSEFSGSSRVLRGSIGINPWRRDEIVNAIGTALKMTESELSARHQKDLEYIVSNSRTKWAERILVDLKRTKKLSTEGEHMGYGLGLSFRMLEFNAGFKLLDTEAVAKAYRSSYRRVLLFDYGNTLVTEERGRNDFSKYLGIESDRIPDGTIVSKAEVTPAPSEVLSALSLMCSDPRNTVFVLSGKDRSDLEKTLGSVRGLGLAAEHGYLYKWGDSRASSCSEDEWLCTKDNFDDSWKDLTHSVMDTYTQRTHGTYVELKGSALLWQYRDADPEFGHLQAKELHDQLTQVLENFQVEVLAGSDYLEVRPEGVDKGVIVDRILSTLESKMGNYVDFIMCIGDDQSDELMFQYLEEVRSRPKLFTVTVGKKPSAAKYFVNDVEQVKELLSVLTKVSTALNRNLSLNDLRLFDGPRQASHPSKLKEESEEILDSRDLSMEEPLSMETSSRLTLKNKCSMSMSAISSVANACSGTSFTYEQYFSKIEETEDDQGGIFF